MKNIQPGLLRSDFDRPVLSQEKKKNKVQILNPEDIGPALFEIKKNLKEVFKQNKISVPRSFNLGDAQLSLYSNGDYYGIHRDKTELGITFILFIEKKNFTGGLLKLYDLKTTRAFYKLNRAVLFSSSTAHEVSPISGNGERVSLQFFLTSKKSQIKFHNDIASNRKRLGKSIINFANNQNISLEEAMATKAKINDFKNHTLLGSYRYLYYSLFKKIPTKVISKVDLLSGFNIHVQNDNRLILVIRCSKDKIWTEIEYNKRLFVFDFHLLSSEILTKLSSL